MLIPIVIHPCLADLQITQGLLFDRSLVDSLSAPNIIFLLFFLFLLLQKLASCFLVFFSIFISYKPFNYVTQEVHPCISTDSSTPWKKSHFSISDWSDLNTIDNISITLHVFSKYKFTSLWIDEMWLPRYKNRSTNFRGLPLRVVA